MQMLYWQYISQLFCCMDQYIIYYLFQEVFMTIREMKEALDAKFLYGEELADLDAQFVFSADMMSDVLAYCGKCSVLITGLCNPQIGRAHV